jgi:8-amino-7-oxononanoate synthase
VIDLTSSCYLGLRHASHELRPWDRLTSCAPAALAEEPLATELAGALAELQGCERSTFGTSTFHLLWDLFGLLVGEEVIVYLDAASYPISRWAVERAEWRGVPVRHFAHHDAAGLRQLIAGDAGLRRRPVVVADGFCPACGRSAPLADFLEAVGEYGGQLILDDTQALGVLGHSPGPEAPYGRGGGGSVRWAGVEKHELLLVCSLAKGFGAPLAALSGSDAAVSWFEQRAETRAHCSPPSFAALHAAEHALAENEASGDALRQALAQRVRHFCSLLEVVGLGSTGGLFPVQTLAPIAGVDPTELHRRLGELGVRALLHRDHLSDGVRLSFLLSAALAPADVELAAAALARAAGRPFSPGRVDEEGQ